MGLLDRGRIFYGVSRPAEAVSGPGPDAGGRAGGAIGILAQLQVKDVGELMASRLGDPDPGVRAAAIACLVNGDDEEGRQRAAAAATRGLLKRGRPRGRRTPGSA